MTGSANSTETTGHPGFLAPKPGQEPVDHCFRCGVETPAGVGLCEAHNRGHLSGPSSTQMHATVFLGILFGVIGLFLLARLVVTTSGPFDSDVTSAAATPDGGVALTYVVSNEGDSDGIADCRITRDGVPRPDDLAFRTGVLPGGETVSFARQLEAPPVGSARYDTDTLTVICS